MMIFLDSKYHRVDCKIWSLENQSEGSILNDIIYMLFMYDPGYMQKVLYYNNCTMIQHTISTIPKHYDTR